MRLETVIGSTADHWPLMQAAYDAAEVRSRVSEITKGLMRVPYRRNLLRDSHHYLELRRLFRRAFLWQ